MRLQQTACLRGGRESRKEKKARSTIASIVDWIVEILGCESLEWSADMLATFAFVASFTVLFAV
jgi:hypothetical protein